MLRFVLASGAAITLAASTSFAAVIQFQEGFQPDGLYTHDIGWIRSDNTSANNGANNRILVGGLSNGGILRGLASFPLTGIPAGSTITSVTLRVVSQNDTGSTPPLTPLGFHTMEIRNVTGSFSDANMTWGLTVGNSSVSFGSTVLSTSSWEQTAYGPTAGGDAQSFFNSTAAFVAAAQAALDANQPFNFGFMCPEGEAAAAASPAGRVVMRFYSDEGGGAGDPPAVDVRPLLTIEYEPIPEPASLGLLGSVGFLVMRRRRA